MAENSTLSSSLGPKTDIQITTLTIVVAAISLFLTVIFLFLLYLYAKYYCGSRYPRGGGGRRRFIFFSSFGSINPSAPNRGLDPSLLASLPITLYKPTDSEEGIECAVCLSELAAGEEARLLPKCGHQFHLQCIDAWFRSNSTCPICRCPVEESTDLPVVDAEEDNSASSHTTEGFLLEDKRSPKMWSFRRILSSSPRLGDVEQGMGGSVAEIFGEGSSS